MNVAENDSDNDALLRPHVEREANLAMQSGALAGAVFCLLGAIMVVVLTVLGVVRDIEVGAAFAALCGVYSFALSVAGRHHRIRGRGAYLYLVPFTAAPTFLFLGAQLFLAGGAAQFILGPIAFIYFPIMGIAAFTFDKRVIFLVSFLCAAQYFVCYLVARKGLMTLHSDVPIITQDLTAAPVYALRCFLMLGMGAVLASLGSHARRLAIRVLHEERDKLTIGRLFGQFVSPEVKDRIIREKAGHIGERKQVAVLFSDIRSFTTTIEEMDPAEVVIQLNEYFDRMVAAITENGGVVDKFVGDAVMAVFGGVIDLDNPCESAVRAALAMRKNLAVINEKRNARGLASIYSGIGIEFGMVLQGTIGSADRKEFTVVGDAVNTASRIEGVTKEYEFPILISGNVREPLSEELKSRCESVGSAKVKGKQREIDLYGVR